MTGARLAWRTAFVLWLASVGAGAAYAWRYSLQDGGASPLQHWPAQTALALHPALPTLVMFMMANCPCSAASLHELNALLQDRRVQARAYVVVEPADHAPGGAQDLQQAAQAIPGAEPIADPIGAIRRSFAARTSGETHLYSAGGQLLFKGGITAARGHEGLSRGRQLLASLLTGHPAAASPVDTPVYGCHFAQNEEKHP